MAQEWITIDGGPHERQRFRVFESLSVIELPVRSSFALTWKFDDTPQNEKLNTVLYRRWPVRRDGTKLRDHWFPDYWSPEAVDEFLREKYGTGD